MYKLNRYRKDRGILRCYSEGEFIKEYTCLSKTIYKKTSTEFSAKFPNSTFEVQLDNPNEYKGGNIIVSKNGAILFKKPFLRIDPYKAQLERIKRQYPDCKIDIERHIVPVDVSSIIDVLGSGKERRYRQSSVNYIHWWTGLTYGLAEKLAIRHINKPALFLTKENIKTIYERQKQN